LHLVKRDSRNYHYDRSTEDIMKIPIYQVDAFADRLFAGNPAAVCPLAEWIDEDLMQRIAAENNLSETAFFVKRGDGFDIRWFTPRVEIDLAGHPTLATAHVIFNHLEYGGKEITFHSQKRGELRVTRTDDLIRLDFPAAGSRTMDPPETLIRGLGAEPREAYEARDMMAVYETEDEILSLVPDFRILRELDTFGVIATAPGREVDFVSRFFAPQAGIDEDPVTGSAHTILIPYWAKRLNRDKLHARQVSARGGELFCEFHGERVFIAGRAVTYMIGEIEVSP
jgi:PhzF family phenazine biosynthesis protein